MKRLLGRQVRQSSLVFAVSLAFLLGIGLAGAGLLMDASIWALCLIGIIFTLKKRRAWALIWMILFGLSFGWWHGSIYQNKLAVFENYYGQEVTLIAEAGQDATYGKFGRMEFDVHGAKLANGQKLTGKIGLNGFGVADVYAGDTIKATGKLYSARGSYQARMSFAQFKVVERGDGIVDKLRRRFNAGMQNALPEPLASFGMGLLIGQKATLPESVYQSLLMVGLVHIIAVSGYNLTIILRASNKLLSGRSRRLSTLLALALIGIFLLFAGSSASIVRASIVSLLAIGAAYYGRSVKPLVLIMLSGAITAWLNPYYVWSDIGWYLSFLAFFGVLVVAPMVLARLPGKVTNSLLGTVAIESLCAEIMTMPYVLFVFGQMSFVGLIANALVVALVPLAMLLCLVAGLAGMLLTPLVGWLAWPAKLLLNYMLDVARLLSQLPNVFVEGISVGLVQLLFFYSILLFVVWILWRKTGSVNFNMHMSSVEETYKIDDTQKEKP